MCTFAPAAPSSRHQTPTERLSEARTFARSQRGVTADSHFYEVKIYTAGQAGLIPTAANLALLGSAAPTAWSR